MKLKNISSKTLPAIDESIKECVNLGQWLLFKSSSIKEKDDACFYLKVGHNIFGLDKIGNITHEIGGEVDDLSIDELFYFSDIPRPNSLSNLTVAVMR
ncbi:hypothetical protein [Lysobacter hankyongensis]|uniref:Uncharacterized protein n=1 Tax=Lysobacter hankyongensis TaxID=1176535 RepID=A0ABP9B5S4_9GAMM